MVIFRENSIQEYFNEALNIPAETYQEHRMITNHKIIHEGAKLAYATYNDA